MFDSLEDNPTREKIVLALKRNGSMSVDDLSGAVSITPMGVRQHLLILERNGIVEYVTKKHGVGRPGFLYKLTERADDLFPKAYQKFSLDILTDIEKFEGRERIAEIFSRRRERLFDEMSRLLTDEKNLPERVSALATILERDGYMVELGEDSSGYTLKTFNCPISKVASRFKEVCNQDLQLLTDLTGVSVTRRSCQSEGDQACEYAIPKVLGT